jgi:hypothetical protein
MKGTPPTYALSSADRAIRELAKSFSARDHAIAAIGEKTRADLAAVFEGTSLGALASTRKLETDIVSQALDEFRVANAAGIEKALSTMNAAFGTQLAEAVEKINFSFKGPILEAVRAATPIYSIDLAPHVQAAIAGAVELAEAPKAQDEALASLPNLRELSAAERHALENSNRPCDCGRGDHRCDSDQRLETRSRWLHPLPPKLPHLELPDPRESVEGSIAPRRAAGLALEPGMDTASAGSYCRRRAMRLSFKREQLSEEEEQRRSALKDAQTRLKEAEQTYDGGVKVARKQLPMPRRPTRSASTTLARL